MRRAARIDIPDSDSIRWFASFIWQDANCYSGTEAGRGVPIRSGQYVLERLDQQTALLIRSDGDAQELINARHP